MIRQLHRHMYNQLLFTFAVKNRGPCLPLLKKFWLYRWWICDISSLSILDTEKVVPEVKPRELHVVCLVPALEIYHITVYLFYYTCTCICTVHVPHAYAITLQFVSEKGVQKHLLWRPGLDL